MIDKDGIYRDITFLSGYPDILSTWISRIFGVFAQIKRKKKKEPRTKLNKL